MADERLPALARELSSQFDEDRRDREPLEKRWLEDYRLYMGIYDPEIETEIKKGRSRLFMRQAKVKTDTVVARLMDILFPRAGDRNWDLQPTPEPTLDATFMAYVDFVRTSLGEDPVEEDYFCNVWLLGDQIIKAVRTPMRGVEFPFQIFSIEKDESGLCGQGIPRIMRDPHRAYNATIRSMMDNAALTSGPIVGINIEALRQGEDPDDLYARRILKFDDGKDMREALIFWQAQSHTSEFLAMAKHFEDVQDVLTVPRWVHGDGNVSDAAKTLGGLSMLMGAMSINLAEMVKTFDDDVTSQFITALYFWNMDFNSRGDIKGDFNVVATGSTALMQKEVQSQRLMQFLSLASQPELAGMINFAELLKEIAVSMQVPAKLVNDEATIRQNQQRQMVMQVQAEQQSKLETLLNEMHSRGIAPDVSLQHLLARVLEQAAGGQDAAGPGQPAAVAGMPGAGWMTQALPAGSEGEPGRAA
ncbi:hypothetical protein [Desulfovibrio sp. TomC]|uniref:hypothetical protein n=1 Tax=Desulfovibrio sp. TomC TaxID=1562888 RepID=UPI000574E9AA|nr:hypothetical protein [Desulfovibrio sp. TomC]KHK04037.1 hypothetical protein NY78_0479 [Desulfovibrio sp. TomC]